MNNRIAVITAGHKGIGLSVSHALTEAGTQVVIGVRECESPDTVQRVAEATQGQGILLTLDVRSTDSVTRFATQVKERVGEVDILVNNAGVASHQYVEAQSDEDWDAVIDTNLSGPVRTTRAFLPSMKARGWGRIINIASTAATTAVADSAAYCASKSGLLGLSRAVAVDGAPYGVNCITVSPTWIETDMLHQSAASIAKESGQTSAEVLQKIKDSNPQKRLVQASEIASLVNFVCSDACAGLTMEDIQVNAGAFW